MKIHSKTYAKGIYECRRYFAALFILCSTFSCKKFVDVDPPETKVSAEAIFSTDATATSSVVGIYARMMTTNITLFNGAMSIYPSLSADEIARTAVDANYDPFSKNALLNSSTAVTALWASAYNYIYHANTCIEGLTSAPNLTASVRSQLIGEAKFSRALSYLYLVNLFGDVPLITTTSVDVTATMARTPSADVYTQIVTDLLDAKSKMTDTYQGADKARPNRQAASALLARVYLYKQDWANAEAEASAVIGSNIYSLPNTAAIGTVFLRGSTETIWQLAPIGAINTAEGSQFIPSASATTLPRFAITSSLNQAFESGDQRKNSWVGTKTVSGTTYAYPAKYKVTSGTPYTEANIMLRLAEQYLIRAEARAQGGNIAGAQSDINVIRKRAGLGNTAATDKASLLLAIEQERRIEFFCELGHRWFDLKRTGRVDVVLTALKGTTVWQSTDALYPIPLNQLTYNTNLTQNPGY